MNKNDYRAVVGINFGTKHSSFGYACIYGEIIIHNEWPYNDKIRHDVKVPTVLLYDRIYENVKSWGFPALEVLNEREVEDPTSDQPVELFKLPLGKKYEVSPLPYKRAITDYLHKLCEIVKEKVCNSSEEIKFYTEVFIILTVPDNFPIATWTMRECAFKAGLLDDCNNRNLEVITESEAAAHLCLERLCGDLPFGGKFILVDYEYDAVSLTTRQLLDEKLTLIKKRVGDDSVGSYANQEFLNVLERKVGSSALNLIRKNYQQQLQRLMQEFSESCSRIFNEFPYKPVPFYINLCEIFPAIKQYCNGEYHDNLKETEWRIMLNFEDYKTIYDPIIKKIIQLLDSQLRLCADNCFALSLIGRIGESKYFQSKIKENFSAKVKHICLPYSPGTAITRGAVLYGLNYVDLDCNDGIVNKLQVVLSQTIEKFEVEKKKSQDKNRLYNDLQEKYAALTNKEEANQREIEEKYAQLENLIKLQEQKIDQLQQSMKLKENQLQHSEKENDNLYQKNVNLMNKLENLLQNSLLDDELSDYQSGDTNQNYIMNINNDISELNDNLKKYITDIKQDVIVNIEEIKNLLLLYKCPNKITNQDDDWLLIQAIFQRHIIEIIFSHATEYFQSTGQPYHLESDIINEASLLSTLLTNISKYRTGNNKIAHETSTKLREQIYLTLGNCGFNNINGENNTAYEHPFIADCKKKLNNTINELRIVKDQEKKIVAENLAAIIICQVIKIFWFRLKVGESVVQYVWIPCNVKVDKTFMEISNIDNIDDDENLYVDLCYFPLIGSDLTSNNQKVYIPAKVIVRKNQN